MSKVGFFFLIALVATAAANRDLLQGYGGGDYGTGSSGGEMMGGGGMMGGGTSGGGTSTGGTATTGGTTAGQQTTTTTTGGGGGSGSFSIDPWALGQNYGDRQASVGDTATFTWTEGLTHGLYLLRDSSCPSSFQDGQNGMKEVQAPTAGPKTVTYTFQEAGTFWFACPVDGHCDAGMHFKVTVS